MKYSLKFLCVIIFISAVTACKPRKPVVAEAPATLDVPVYRASVKRINDLVHTSLILEPDFEKREMKGTATIILQPHFYPTDSLTLHAKYMRIEQVGIIQDTAGLKGNENHGTVHPATFTYDSLFLRIRLDKTYTKNETYAVRITYVAQPEKVRSKGSDAINDAKGLYFINHDGKIKDKPIQLWTQSETESASCWFPTIDAPNQKSSEELRIIVPDSFKTISNGRLVMSKGMPGNKRLDYWRQDLPHSPYLFAVIAGNFAVVKDQWRNKQVNYYVEPAYAPYARMVFGNTPEMIEFYSTKLGVTFPWDKYHQVVVRDFVSGAMENTGCVVHYGKLQHDSREHLDNTYEDIIAHELFHHWFGDLVTCESWSNLPLNESFATYGEYLWNEHRYGRDEADVKLGDFHEAYYNESEYKSENLVRYFYDDQEDMFDAHSYQKGGSILHMLRKYVGDDAFFASLNLYLTRHAYKTAEIHHLRMAFEETTGEDLNWFFNQWFLNNGHPDIRVFHQTYSGSAGIYGITVVQQGDAFRLPVDVDVYTEEGIERHRLMIEKDSQTFGIPCAAKPLCVIFDAENQLLSRIEETKTVEGWESQMKHAGLSSQKLTALNQLLNIHHDRKRNIDYCKGLLSDAFWNTRATALNKLYSMTLSETELQPLMEKIRDISLNDPKAAVRRQTVNFFRDKGDEEQLKAMLKDSSYEVVNKSLSALSSINRKAAFAFADKHRDEQAEQFQQSVFIVIGRTSTKDEVDFFIGKIKEGNTETAYNSGYALAFYIFGNNTDKTDEVLSRLETMAKDKSSHEGSNAISALNMMQGFYAYQLYLYGLLMNDKEGKKLYRKNKDEAQLVYDRIENILETNK
mgnify:FL=1